MAFRDSSQNPPADRSETAWQAYANCAGLDPAMFFPERGEDHRPAIAVCASCLVRAECYEYGKDEQRGIWGGVSVYADRRRSQPSRVHRAERRRQRKAASKDRTS